jgi:hypothetical protein
MGRTGDGKARHERDSSVLLQNKKIGFRLSIIRVILISNHKEAFVSIKNVRIDFA